MRYAFIYILLCLCQQTIAQTARVCVLSSEDSLPVPGAILGSKALQVTIPETGCAVVRSGTTHTVRCAGYQSSSFVVKNDTVIYIQPAPFDVPGVTISSSFLPDTVWGSPQYHVEDYCFVRDGIALLVYGSEKRWKKMGESKTKMLDECALVVATSTGEQQMRLSHHHYSLRAVADTLAFLWNDKEAFALVPMGTERWSLSVLPLDTFQTHIAPIYFTLPEHIAYTDYRDDFPEASFYARNTSSGKDTVLRTIRNDWTMEIMRSEWKYLSGPDKVIAAQMEEDLGIDKEFAAAYMRGFQHTHYWQPLGTKWKPFAGGHGLLDPHHRVFYSWKMAAGDPVLFSLDPETIAPKGWKWNGDFEWISTDQIALFYTKAHQTSVWHVTLGSGEKKAIGSLAMPFAENIQYRDGKVYYIWRPFESPQKRFLYSQKM